MKRRHIGRLALALFWVMAYGSSAHADSRSRAEVQGGAAFLNTTPALAIGGTGWINRRAGVSARVYCIRLPGAGLILSSVNGRKWTEPPGKLLHDEVVPAQICRHRGVGLCGCEGVGNEGHEGRLAGRRTCAEHVAVESAHGRLAVPLSPRQLVSASSAATVGPGGSLAGRWVWRLPRRIPVPHGGARPRGSRRWRRRQ